MIVMLAMVKKLVILFEAVNLVFHWIVTMETSVTATSFVMLYWVASRDLHSSVMMVIIVMARKHAILSLAASPDLR